MMEPEAKWRQRWYRLCLAQMLHEFRPPLLQIDDVVKSASAVVADRWAARRSPETFYVMRREFLDECRKALREKTG